MRFVENYGGDFRLVFLGATCSAIKSDTITFTMTLGKVTIKIMYLAGFLLAIAGVLVFGAAAASLVWFYADPQIARVETTFYIICAGVLWLGSLCLAVYFVGKIGEHWGNG